MAVNEENPRDHNEPEHKRTRSQSFVIGNNHVTLEEWEYPQLIRSERIPFLSWIIPFSTRNKNKPPEAYNERYSTEHNFVLKFTEGEPHVGKLLTAIRVRLRETFDFNSPESAVYVENYVWKAYFVPGLLPSTPMPKSAKNTAGTTETTARTNITYDAMCGVLSELEKQPENVEKFWQNRFISQAAEAKFGKLFQGR